MPFPQNGVLADSRSPEGIDEDAFHQFEEERGRAEVHLRGQEL